jgi:type I restriction enzyme S subunit
MSQVELTTLGKSCEFFNGKAHEKSINENGKYIVVNSKFISSEGKSFKRTNEQLFPLYKGDIVMVMSDVPNGKALAKCFIIDKDDTYSLNQRICCIRSKEFDTKYLYYQLNRHEHFLAFNNGENQTNLRKDDILACPLIKPSMEEQIRMVAELDVVKSKMNQAKSNVERNIANSLDIFQSELNNCFSNQDGKWKQTSLGQVCQFVRGPFGGSLKKNIFKTEGYAVYEQQHAIYDQFDEIRYFIDEKKFEEMKRFELKAGDLIMSCSGTIGKVAIVPNGIQKGIINQALLKLTPKDILNVTFLKYYMESLTFKIEIAKNSQGAAIKNVASVAILKLIQVPLPAIEEQNQIVERLNKLLIEVKKLESNYTNKLYFIDEFNSGIFKKAFENELIETK